MPVSLAACQERSERQLDGQYNSSLWGLVLGDRLKFGARDLASAHRVGSYDWAIDRGIRMSRSIPVHSLAASVSPRQPIRRQSQSWRPSDHAKAENKCRRSCDRARKKARGGPWKTPDEGGTFARPLQTTE